MRKTSRRSRGGLLKHEGVAFGEEPVRVPAQSLPPPSRSEAPAGKPSSAPDTADGKHLEGEPQVHLHRGEDGSVRSITVRCPCGREITMQCEYLDDGGADDA